MIDQDCTDLRKYLDGSAPRNLSGWDELPDLLASCWDIWMTADTHGMTPEKLGRMEQVTWNPPKLSFDIERHGGIGKGSINAEIQTWSIIVGTTLTASCNLSGKRLKRKGQQKLKVEPLVVNVVHLIEGRMNDERLHWLSDSRVQVLIGKIIPEGSPSQTNAGRRKRFSKCLEHALKQCDWIKVSGTAAHTYEFIESRSDLAL